MLAILLSTSLLSNIAAAEPERSGITNEWNIYGATVHPTGTYFSEKRLEHFPATIEAWVCIPGPKSGTIFGNYAGNKKHNFTFSIEEFCRPQLRFTSTSGEYYDFTFAKAAIEPNTWTHIAIVYSKAEHRVFCYINGVLKDQSTDTQWYDAPDAVLEDAFSIAGDTRSMNVKGFTGTLSDVTVFRDIRTPEEIYADYYSGPDLDDPDLMIHYDLSKAAPGEDIPDASGNGYTMRYDKVWLTQEEMDAILTTDNRNYTHSIAFLPDIQCTTEFYPDKLPYVFDYLVANRESKNIQYLITLGDLTNSNTMNEWQLLQSQFAKLNDQIPYALLRGNHDIFDNNRAPLFDQLFARPGTYYYDFVAANGGFQNPASVANTYLLFTAGKVDYILLNLDYGSTDATLEWANRILEEHANRRAIIVTHGYLNSDGSYLSAGETYAPINYASGLNNGDEIWDKLVRKHANISMVVCGHISSDTVICSCAVGDAGNKIYQLMMDAQNTDYAMASIGLVNLMHFTEDGRYARVESYSTTMNKYFHQANTWIELDFGEWTPAATEPELGEQAPATEAPQSQETEAVTQRIPPAVIWSCIGIAAVAVLALLVWILNKKKAV